MTPASPAAAGSPEGGDAPFALLGPRDAPTPLVLDSPHSGTVLPADFGTARTPEELREGEDCFIDELYAPAAARGVPLLAARIARTYIDVNRHAGDIDIELLADHWPDELSPSGKAALGKALAWRTLDDGRPIYARKLRSAELLRRIARVYRPYHEALRGLLDAAHRRHGFVLHLNCHSMNAVGGAMAEGGAGVARADVVLGDRDGTSAAPVFTAFVRDRLRACGYDVRINDPFKGVEIVRAFGDPQRGRHSLQIEVNKRLYMDGNTGPRHAGYATLQTHLMQLVEAIVERHGAAAR